MKGKKELVVNRSRALLFASRFSVILGLTGNLKAAHEVLTQGEKDQLQSQMLICGHGGLKVNNG